MTAIQERKLSSIKNYHTRYELVITDGSRSYRIAYTCKRSRSGLYHSCVGMAQFLVRLTGRDAIDFGKRAADGATIGGWSIRFSGRTQRECILSGELPYIGSLAA